MNYIYNLLLTFANDGSKIVFFRNSKQIERLQTLIILTKIRKGMKQNNDFKKTQLKKHRRIKSQQLLYSSQCAGVSDLKDHGDSQNIRKHGYTVLYLNPSNPSVHLRSKQASEKYKQHSSLKHQTKVIVNPDTSMKNIKQIICQKLALTLSQESNLFLFSAEPEDINFDYRLVEQIGNVGQEDKKINYFFVNPEAKVNIGSYDLQEVAKVQEGKDISDYFVYDCLSVGGFSKVFLVRSKKSGKFYAAKFIDKNYDKSPKFQDLIYNQRYINELLDYKMLVKMHSFIQTKKFFIFILDYCPSGQLFCLMKSHRDMTQAQARFYFIETILAIDYMHSRSIIYRDIKPENILLDKNGHIKIADFGLAKIMREKSTSYCGSLEYMAPEIVLGNEHSFGVDHYCLGSLLFEMMVGCPPFYNPNFTSTQTKYHIVNSDVKFPSGRNYSPELIDFVNKLLDKNPKTRLGSLGGIKQILAHPWVGKFDRQKYQKELIEPPFKLSLDKSNFETTYLPIDDIEQMKNRISLQIQQKDINAGFRKKLQKSDLVGSKCRNRLKSTENCKYSATTTPSKMSSYLNPYQMQLNKFNHKNKTNKKLSFSAPKYTFKNDSQSLHYESASKSNKNRSLTRNSKVQKDQHSSMPGIKDILKIKVNKQNCLKSSFNDLHRNRKNLHRKSTNMDKEMTMKSKFETKAKQIREANKFLKAYLKSANKQKENKIANRISKALLSPGKY